MLLSPSSESYQKVLFIAKIMAVKRTFRWLQVCGGEGEKAVVGGCWRFPFASSGAKSACWIV